MAVDSLLVVLVGPTASGKTALSLALAQQFGGEVVNCDSVAMYREFEIGTAKPSFAERKRAPHHLFDCIDPADFVTAGEYGKRARSILSEIRARNQLPIVVGGTGLYLRALLEGLFAGPPRSEALRERLRQSGERKGNAHLHKLLSRLDSAAAGGIHANDRPKVIRAIEVCLMSRQKMSDLWQQGRDPLTGFHILRIGLNPDRPQLYERINRRAQHMFDAGLVDETKSLLQRYGDSAPPLNSLGYKQALQLIRGEIDASSALQAAQQAHRNYAKRQLTWFRREPDVHWLNGFGDDPSLGLAAATVIQQERTA